MNREPKIVCLSCLVKRPPPPNIAFRLQACNIHTPTDDDRFWGVLLTFNLPGNIALQSRAHFISNTSYHASHFNLLLMPTKVFRAKQSLLFAVCDVCIGTWTMSTLTFPKKKTTRLGLMSLKQPHICIWITDFDIKKKKNKKFIYSVSCEDWGGMQALALLPG